MPEITITEKTLARPVTTPASMELPAIAWQGIFKDYLDMVAPTTEAADAFHYAAFLQVFGCTLGRRLQVYHAGRQFPNFYTCLVGRSGLTRKDTAWSRAEAVLSDVPPSKLGGIWGQIIATSLLEFGWQCLKTLRPPRPCDSSPQQAAGRNRTGQ